MLAALTSLAMSGSQVYVMAPLSLMDSNQNFYNRGQWTYWLDKLRDARVDGVMIDVWWGYTEPSEKNYKWTGYQTAFEDIKNRGLKIIPVFSFHQCGGNVGDDCNIPIPSFARSSSVRPFFVDQEGHVDYEYISFAYDEVKITGRTPIEMYRDWFSAFKQAFESLISSSAISEIEVGLGPCGELRYPGYQMAYWSYPGCGEFQFFDPEFTKLLQKDAIAAGHSDWGHNPTNVGGYNTQPGGSEFWRDDASNGWKSEYGRWFIKWYAEKLNEHGDRVLKVCREILPNAHLSAKISGIHWWYMTSCHCAEATSGFNNFYDYDGYRDMLTVYKRYNVDVCFTCLEMVAGGSGSNPPALVQQIANDAQWAGLMFEGENALECYDWDSFMRIKGWVSKGLREYTHLRMKDTLFYDNNYNTFKAFVDQMHNA